MMGKTTLLYSRRWAAARHPIRGTILNEPSNKTKFRLDPKAHFNTFLSALQGLPGFVFGAKTSVGGFSVSPSVMLVSLNPLR